MADNNISQSNAGSDAQDQCPQATHAEMRGAILEIDSQVLSTMREIAAVAAMAMRWLQSPVESVTHYETVYQALAMIREKALHTDEAVWHHASSVDCATMRPDRLMNALPA